jgi:hypothetical protein
MNFDCEYHHPVAKYGLWKTRLTYDFAYFSMFANRSKDLLYRYINSENVISTIGQAGCDSIQSFLRGYVFPHAARFAGYVYFKCRSFEAHANTPLEGTNRGLKYGEFAVKPNMQADRSTKQMLIQDQNKAVENMKQASKELHATKLYTSTRTSTFLNRVSESMLANEGQRDMMPCNQYSRNWWLN